MSFVTTEIQDAVAVLTIDRPKALNALNPEVLADLKAAFEAIDQNTVRCVVLTGAGDKSFVAGADIGSMSTMTKAEGEAFGKLGNDVFLMIEHFPLPVIAAVNGFALGVKGKGFQLAMATLDGGRIGIASQALGIAEGAIDETVAYVKERKQFGRSIAQFQNTQFELAEMKARVDAAKYLVYAAAQKKQAAMDGQKVRYSVEAAEAKLIAARTASDVTRRCLQLFGGYGYTRDYPIERMMRDAKITEIYEGTSEVQMMVIGGALLK